MWKVHNNIDTFNIVYLQYPTISELKKAAHQQLSPNQIINYKITTFMDNDGIEYDQDDDLEDAWPDISDDENDTITQHIEPLKLKLILEPIVKRKFTPDANSNVNIQASNVYQSKQYAVIIKLCFDIDSRIIQTPNIQYLQHKTIKEIEYVVYNQLCSDNSTTYRIKSIMDNAGVEFNDDDDVEDAFDDIDENAVLKLNVTLIANTPQPISTSKQVENTQNIPLFRQLLIDWELDMFADKLEEDGWTDPMDWKELNDNDLKNDIGFGKGHLIKFKKKYQEWYRLQVNVGSPTPTPTPPKVYNDTENQWIPSAIETTYAMLSNMGFTHELCVKAAMKFPDNVSDASEWILQQQNNEKVTPGKNYNKTEENIVDNADHEINEYTDTADDAETEQKFVNDVHSQLVDMQYPYQLAMDAAFRFKNNINDAITWIKSQETVNNEELNDARVRPMVQRSRRKLTPNDVDIENIIIDQPKFKTNNEIVEDCKSIKLCPSLKKIVTILNLYRDTDKSQELALLISAHQDFQYLLNHYHHVLRVHNEFDVVYKLLVQENNFQCDVSKCKIFLRNSEKKQGMCIATECNNSNLLLYMDILDTIHCYFVHSVEEIQPDSKEYNKFSTQIESELITKIEELKSEDLNNDEKFIRDLQYSFGQRFDYWNNESQPKWGSIKQEVMDNKIYTISMSEYDAVYKKSVHFLANSNKLKTLKCTKLNKYGISINSSVDVEHIMVLVLYTDFDTLSHHFSTTFRKTHKNETYQQVQQRNKEFWRWSRVLIEAVNCFGEKIDSSNVDIFYHGISMIYFDSFIATFNSPTSTTTQLSLATAFAQKNGLVLELKMNKRKWGRSLMYFNCTFVSCFAHEDERLFIQPEDQRSFLEFASIRNISTNENYKQYIDALTMFQKIVSNDYYVNIPQRSIQIISSLMSKHDQCPQYILKCFEKWANNRKQLRLNFETLPTKLSKYFCRSTQDNLLAVDKVNILFKNVEKISCRQVGYISENYLKSLFVMLNEVNKFEHSKLQKVYLLNINNVHTIDLEEFKIDGWNWQIAEYDGDDLVAYKTNKKSSIPKQNVGIIGQNKYVNKEWLKYDRYLSWRKGERISMCSKVERERLTSTQPRILLLSNYEKLYLIDENKQKIEEQWITKMIKKVEIVGYHDRFILHLVDNTIQFKCVNNNAAVWQSLIAEMSTFQV